MRILVIFALLSWSVSAMASKPPNNTILAMVMLEEPALPSEKGLFEFALRQWPGMPKPTKMERKDDVVVFGMEGGFGTVALMPAPIPWSELEGPCATAWYWPEACQVLKSHKAHLIISLSGSQLGAAEAHMLLTKMVASAANATGAVGVYWGAGTVVHPTELFIEQSREMKADQMPLHLWVDFRMYSEGTGKYTLFTTGLKALGLMEIETKKAKVDPEFLYGFAFNVAHYLVEQGAVIKDNDTVGENAGQKIKVRHAPSMWNKAERVYQLLF